MLEFLKSAVSSSLYEYAMDCERNLKSFNSLVSMHTFFENMFKQIFSEWKPDYNKSEINRKKFSEFLNDVKFCKFLEETYGSFDKEEIYKLNKIRNIDVHNSESAKRPENELVKKYFKMVFEFSAEYYNIHSGEKKPRWNEEDFKVILEKVDPKALERQKKENEKLQSEIRNTQTELQKILDNYHEALYEQELATKAKKDAEDKLQEITNKKRVCNLCGNPLELRRNRKDGTWFWGCSQYPKTKCRGSCNLTSEDLKIVDKFNLAQQKIIELPSTEAPIQVIEAANKKLVEIIADPLSYEICNPKRFLFQSITIPKEVFDDREIYHFSKYSQFYISASITPQNIDTKIRTIYSMALRMLNRGIVLQADLNVYEKIKKYFESTEKETCTPNCLSSSTVYINPILSCDSNREKEFALKVFPDVFGHEWANFVMPQVELSALVLDSRKEVFTKQRVDFVVNYHNQHIVIELDGKEHLAHRDHDKAREEALAEAGYLVLRYKNEDVDNNVSSIISDLKQKIKQVNVDETIIPVSKKRLLACKLYHQIVIAIFKGLEQGYILENSNLRFASSVEVFEQADEEFIFSVALDYVKEIIEAYINIYDLDISLNFNDNDLPITKIMFGDGEEGCNCILIRDCKVIESFLCRIEPFDVNLLPQKTPVSSMKFFLRTIFGFSDFREGQLQAICRILERKDSIILLPTGAGKSIIYQLTSYMVPGMIVVISPLRSLIEDQVMNLYLRNGINNAIPIYSTSQKSEEDKQKDLKKMKHNSSSLLYISPERLQIESFSKNVEVLLSNNNIFTVAIDEAHCVSEWGHEFRAAYLDIGTSSKELFKKGEFKPSIVALTGTASEDVLEDVKRELGINDADSIIKPKTFDRNELNFSIVNCKAEKKIDKLKEILKEQLPNKFGLSYEQFAKCNDDETKSGIIFAPVTRSQNRKNYAVFDIREDLYYNMPEIKSGCYFSKTPKNYDEKTWEATIKESSMLFKRNKLNLLVATKAYGMGIDKSNIRYIIHNGLTSSLEQYYQEAGRAARDGKDSECIIVFSNQNPKYNEKILDSTLSFKEFNELLGKSNTDDDLSKALYFHGITFQGIDGETKIIEHIIAEFADKNCTAKSNVTLYLPENKEQNIEANDWAKALVRLKRLGVVERYFYDYKGNYNIYINNFTRETIINAYLTYVEKFSVGRMQVEKNKFYSINKDGWEFVAYASKILIDFIYEKIESSRRRSIRAMYLLVKELSDLTPKEQNTKMHKYIAKYFSSTDLLDAVYNSKSDGIQEIYDVLDFDPLVVFSEKECIKAADLIPSIQRLLESKAHHPGLLFLQSAAYIKSQAYEKSIVVNDMLSAIQYAKDEYPTSDKTLNDCLTKILNLAIEADYKMFNEMLEGIRKQNKISVKNLLSNMLTSEDVSDKNRDLIALEYVMSKFRIEKKRR